MLRLVSKTSLRFAVATLILLTLLVAASGCTSSKVETQSNTRHASPASTKDITTKPATTSAPTLTTSEHSQWRRSELLNFERNTDALFTAAFPSAAAIDVAPSRSGTSLRLQPGTRRVDLKLASLMSGRPFPGEWTLLGISLCAEQDAVATLSYQLDGRAMLESEITLPAGRWTKALLDLSKLPATSTGIGTVSIRFDDDGLKSVVWADDLILINNVETIVHGAEGGWSIRRQGLSLTLQRPGAFAFHLATEESQDGWAIEEANALRARFRSNRDDGQHMTVYSDGRVLKDGAFSAVSDAIHDDKRYAAAHESPAAVYIPEELGRVDRNSPGDVNNDGFNERLGAYCVVAAGPRVEVTLTPSGASIPRPILQIAGLPEGNLRVTVEGRLVDRWVRLADGQVIIALPLHLERAATVSVRMQ